MMKKSAVNSKLSPILQKSKILNPTFLPCHNSLFMNAGFSNEIKGVHCTRPCMANLHAFDSHCEQKRMFKVSSSNEKEMSLMELLTLLTFKGWLGKNFFWSLRCSLNFFQGNKHSELDPLRIQVWRFAFSLETFGFVLLQSKWMILSCQKYLI